MELTDLNQETIQTKYKPLSPWATWGLMILFAIPVIGLIALIIFAFTGENVNRKNFARGFAIASIIIGIMMTILFTIFSVSFLTLFDALDIAEYSNLFDLFLD